MPEAQEKLADQANHFLDKFQHPFVGSFISSWVITNWNILYTLIGGFDNPSETIQTIECKYLVLSNISHTVIYPFVGMVLYVYFGPRLLNWYLLHKYKQTVKRKFNESKANDQEPVTKKEHSQLQVERDILKKELESLRAAFNYIRSDKKDVIVPNIGKFTIEGLIAAYSNYFVNSSIINDENVKLKDQINVLTAKLKALETQTS